MRPIRHAMRLVVREPRRSLATLVGVTIASTLVTSVLLFGIASGTTVTRRALTDVKVDAQVVLGRGADANAATAIVAADPAVRTVSPWDLAHFESASLAKAGAATQTSSGVLVGTDASYARTTGLLETLPAAIGPGDIAISRDLASNLGAVPGDTITFQLPGGRSVALLVAGIVSIDGTDLILGPIDAAHRAASANPPANVAVMSRAALESKVLTLIPAGAVAQEPAATGGTGQAPVFAGEPAVRRELQVQLDHSLLPGDPVAAQVWLDLVRRRVERQGAGTFVWVDDAGAALEPLAADLAWGQFLFIFLALPGIALALALSRLAADATADATRRHAALLRARGARQAQLRVVFVGATVLTALVGAGLGAVIGTAIAIGFFGSELAAAGTIPAVLTAAAVAITLTTVLASGAAFIPLRAQLRDEIAATRQELQRNRPPLWQGLYLDVFALAAGAVVYFVAGGAGVHPVLDAEGNPTVTLALTAFVAPLLFWTGGTLLLLRATGSAMRSGARLDLALGRLLGTGGRLAGRSLTARSTAASRVIVVLALTVSFATSVLVFDATYRQQQEVDARLTLGADLKAVPASPANAADAAQAAGPGIAATTPFVDRVVYVGPEAQDMLAVDAATLPSVAPLADSFFQGASAEMAMQALRARPDAILVSAETARDYSIVAGDRIRVRIPNAQGDLTPVDFSMAGVALEFPTAPKDAFLVANQSYVAARTGNPSISFVLARADGDLATASPALAQRLGSRWVVTDLRTTSARLANSITSVDLSGLALLDIGFAVLISAVGVVLFLMAGLAERRREFATLVAVGAESGHVRASVIGETLFVGAAGIVIGVLIGTLNGAVLVQILAGIFDPPANLPVVPMLAIGAVIGAVVLGLGASIVVAARSLSRLDLVSALRER